MGSKVPQSTLPILIWILSFSWSSAQGVLYKDRWKEVNAVDSCPECVPADKCEHELSTDPEGNGVLKALASVKGTLQAPECQVDLRASRPFVVAGTLPTWVRLSIFVIGILIVEGAADSVEVSGSATIEGSGSLAFLIPLVGSGALEADNKPVSIPPDKTSELFLCLPPGNYQLIARLGVKAESAALEKTSTSDFLNAPFGMLAGVSGTGSCQSIEIVKNNDGMLEADPEIQKVEAGQTVVWKMSGAEARSFGDEDRKPTQVRIEFLNGNPTEGPNPIVVEIGDFGNVRLVAVLKDPLPNAGQIEDKEGTLSRIGDFVYKVEVLDQDSNLLGTTDPILRPTVEIPILSLPGLLLLAVLLCTFSKRVLGSMA